MLILTLTAVLLATHPTQGDDFTWHGRIASGKALEIKGVNGSIRASAGSGAEAQVIAHKRAKRSRLEDVKLVVVEHTDGVTICAVYPAPRGRSDNECVPGGGGHNETRDNDVEVEFEVVVPAGVRFVGRTVNGGVDADGLDADVRAYTVNGGVRASSRGTVEAVTVNGSITATLGRADWTDDLQFNTVNGGITLTLPAGLAADLEAETVNGGIESDFPITLEGKINPQRLHGRIGVGGRELNLNTVNGSIRLRKAT